MNMNPWLMEQMADYERDRIERDIKQIRLEKEAMQARREEENTKKASLPRLSLLLLALAAFIRLRPLRVRAKEIRYDGNASPCSDCDY
jgi:hypothetical protein